MSENSIPHKNRKRRSPRNSLLDGPDFIMNAAIGIFQSTPEGRFLSVNPALARMYGYETPEEIVETIADIGRQLHLYAADRENFRQVLEAHGQVENFEYKACRRDGSVFWASKNARVVRDDEGNIFYYEGFTTDITDRKRIEEALRKSEERYRLLFEYSPLGVFHFDINGVIVDCNDNFVQIIGSSKEMLIGMNMQNLPDNKLVGEVRKALAGKTGFYEDIYHSVTAEKATPVKVNFAPIKDDKGRILGCVGIVEDITERKKAEKEQITLQEQLNQAQKMISIGRLAGGIAHDFNNMLTIINGYAEMMAEVLSPSDPMYESVQEIHDAGKRSAVVVRKLLAFARKQTISPVPINLNSGVSGMLKMLHRLIGENIELLWKPGNNLWMVKVDYSQVDQILANLVVNARDAIEAAGKIIIETGNTEIDEAYCASQSGFSPGQFVMLAISDNGCGMNKEILENLFEPFFTTKTVGKGTGLGLPTVYGIVKQNSGFVNVYSEPGKGTTVRIYLPRHLSGDTCAAMAKKEEAPLKGRGETILILEDETEVLGVTKIMLERLEYKVLTATVAEKAMSLVLDHNGRIDLLITDIVMPEMNGRDFADQLNALYPEIKVLFMSGYTSNVIAHHNVLDEGLHFIEKPFTLKKLAGKVQEILTPSCNL